MIILPSAINRGSISKLVGEMEARVEDKKGNDVLGEYFESRFADKDKMGQIFTPMYICDFMSKSTFDEARKENSGPLSVLDPACGSGRFILSAAKIMGRENQFSAIDLDPVCVKMSALNFFLNGIFDSGVMCADALLEDDFIFSYHISFKPLGIFRIGAKEKSRLWHMLRRSLAANKKREAEKQATPPPMKDNPFDGKKGVQSSMF